MSEGIEDLAELRMRKEKEGKNTDKRERERTAVQMNNIASQRVRFSDTCHLIIYRFLLNSTRLFSSSLCWF